MKNHKYSEASKAPGQCPAKVEVCAKGNIVHVKRDLSKHRARDLFILLHRSITKQKVQKYKHFVVIN